MTKYISIVGTGYVALATAACFSELGHRVTLIETDVEKLNKLNRDEISLNEPNLLDLWIRNRSKSRLTVTGNFRQGLTGTDYVFIAIGTPLDKSNKPSVKSVELAAKNIAETAQGPLVIILKNLLPVGTAETISQILVRHGRNGHNFSVVTNPEFLREGSAIHDFMNPTRIVIGSSDSTANESVAKLFEPLQSPIILCDNRTAEMAKYASELYLATKTSFMNEIALLCDEYEVDITQVAEIMGLDPRIGNHYLKAGLGWGESCVAKDIRALISIEKKHGIPLRIVKAAQQINQQQIYVVINKLRRFLGSLEGRTIGVLGFPCKVYSNETRESYLMLLISKLEELGCQVKAYDPTAMETAGDHLRNVTFHSDAYEIAHASDALILASERLEFRTLNMPLIATSMNYPIFIDGHNMYNADEMTQAGFIYEGIGRRNIIKKENSLTT